MTQQGGAWGDNFVKVIKKYSRKNGEKKKNYAMKKLDVPKRVTLPNGRTFIARYRRIKRSELPNNIHLRRTYTPRAAPRNRRRRQRGQRIFSTVKKVLNNSMVRSLAKKCLEYAPGIYRNITKRIKNKKAQRILNSDFAHLALSRGIKAANHLLDAKATLPPVGLD